ncbi:MAG: 2Fe-2S iron-sulfur cluster binding domain-containing protein [Gammaproteobacteria bacterium]|nr:2Fe-2S iron-sulfur cluster binding domain-containing protein [Gammaproteobacteria bacterium]
MVKVTFVDAAGASQTIDAQPGATLMETAIENAVPGIVGFCGGMCSCATCHCYLDAEWDSRIPAPGADELDSLRRVLDRRPRSRLACQIRIEPGLDGLRVELPARQRNP